MSDSPLPMDDLRTLLPDWERRLKYLNRAPSTIAGYLRVVEEFIEFLRERELPTRAPEITRGHLESYFVYLSERPHKRTGKPLSAANTARHYRTLQQLFKWLHEIEEEIERNPFAKMRPPQIPDTKTPILTDEQIKALLAACKNNPSRHKADTQFVNRRDEAIVRLFLDTGARIGEIAGLRLGDVDFEMDVVHVLGKGRRRRAAPFGLKTGEALRRYLRARERYPTGGPMDPDDPGERGERPLWVSRQGRFTDYGIREMLLRRSKDAGIGRIHPHMFRHTFAHRWLAAGGQEQDLMRLAGWRSREMIGRYGASAADERAREAHRRRGLADRF